MANLQAIDLFCGVGGLTHGLLNAGIKVLAGLDNDESCQYAYTKNNGAKFICADIAQYNFKELKKLYSKNSVKILVGCAPCQPFSAHSFKYRKQEADDRWGLMNYFTKAVKEIKPDVISIENVRGFVKTGIFANFVKHIKKMGYQVDFQIVYCPDYGIPQGRQRLVLLGAKPKIGLIEVPNKTHEKGDYFTAADSIKSLPKLKSGEKHEADPLHYCQNLSNTNKKRVRESKPGGTWRDWPKSLLPNCYKRENGKKYTAMYGRMEWNKVAPTITTQFYNYGSGRFGHPTQDRALSLREGALLQTFPDDYDFGDKISLSHTARHIGNAVPPQLGEIIGLQIVKHIKNKKKGCKK